MNLKKININKFPIKILSFILITNQIVNSSVTIDSINEDKINKYKVEIAQQITKDNLVKYAIMGTGIAVVGTTAYKYLFKNNPNKLTNIFSEEEIKKLKDLTLKCIEPQKSTQNLFRKSINFFNNLTSSDIFRAALSEIFIRGCWSLLIEQISKTTNYTPLATHDIFWIMNRSNIYSKFSNIKENAINLDPNSQFLSMNEFSQLKEKAEFVLENPLSDFQKFYLIEHTRIMANKIIDDLLKIFAFLQYKEDELVKQKQYDSIGVLRFHNDQIKQVTNNFREEIKLVLEQLKNNEMPKKGLLEIIVTFNHSLFEVIKNTQNHLSKYF